MAIKNREFVEIEYVGRVASTNQVFDLTSESLAKIEGVFSRHARYGPRVICLGQGRVVKGLDHFLEGKESGVSYTVTLAARDAFGLKDPKLLRMVPSKIFLQQGVKPMAGLRVNLDRSMGTIKSVSSGRVVVDFNHPLAGREVNYEFTITRAITDPKEQLVSFLNTTLRMPIDQFKVSVKENMATVELPLQLPPQFTSALGKKLAELTHLKEVQFTFVPGKQDHGHDHHDHDHGDHHGHQH